MFEISDTVLFIPSAEADKTLTNKDNAIKEDIHAFRLLNLLIL